MAAIQTQRLPLLLLMLLLLLLWLMLVLFLFYTPSSPHPVERRLFCFPDHQRRLLP